jgi:hypothetical protein
MMRSRGASTIVVLSLLASAATAYAECAWVLWSYAVHSSVESYNVESALPTLKECDEAVHDAAKALKSSGYTISGPGNHAVIGQRGERGWKYFCLPDTVDPRGPKGK